MLRGATVTAAGYPVGAVVCVQARDMKQPWCLATSVTNETARALINLYGKRWGIELAFKRLKSLLHIDRLPTWTERGSRSWLHAHLILALLCDDLSQDFLDASP